MRLPQVDKTDLLRNNQIWNCGRFQLAILHLGDMIKIIGAFMPRSGKIRHLICHTYN